MAFPWTNVDIGKVWRRVAAFTPFRRIDVE